MIASRYGFIDHVPRRLFDAVVNHPHGELRLRALSIVELRNALLSGRLPTAARLSWPDEPARTSLLKSLGATGIARCCRADPELVDDTLLRILAAAEAGEKAYRKALRELEADAHVRASNTFSVALRCGKDGEPVDRVLLSEPQWQRIRELAARIAAEVTAERLHLDIMQTWGARCEPYAAIETLLTDLGEAIGAPASEIERLIDTIDPQQSIAMRRILARVPALRDLIRSLGRSVDGPSTEIEMQRCGDAIRRLTPRREQRRARGRIEIRGIERSDEIERMLPSEALLRAQPLLKLLWHARRAERGLLTYHADSLYTRRIQTQQGFEEGLEEARPRAIDGPIIAILDTSASMKGAPEVLAKAVVLQALAVAHLERRRFYAYNFSSSGQLVEHELSLDGDGLSDALAFLTLSFGGATELEEALRRALTRLEREAWRRADILLVTDGYIQGLVSGPSDGAFRYEEPDPALITAVRTARERFGVRVHAALTAPLAEWTREETHMEMGGTAIVAGDAHGAIKRMCDRVHDLCRWLARNRDKES